MPLKQLAENLVKAENEAWLNGNVDAFDEVETPDVYIHSIPPMPDVIGRDAHKKYVSTQRRAFTNFKLEWKYVMSEGDIFAVFYTEHMTVASEMPGVPAPIGTNITGNVTFICRVKIDKIV
jgi:hypothetical protein